MPRDGMRIVEPGQGSWCERMKRNEIGKERKNGGERKSQTPVMPRDSMRREEPGRGPWCENEKKKKKRGEWRRKEVPDFCYATRWHEGRGTWSWTVELKKKRKKRANEGSVSRGLLLLFYPVK